MDRKQFDKAYERVIELRDQVRGMAKGGPYIGPRGGLWADPEHTRHWEGPEATQHVYWRLDHAGWDLDPEHRSAIQDGSGTEEGTSAWGSLGRLLKEESSGLADYARGRVWVTAFTGNRVATGQDGEPVVIPERPIARWEHSDWNGTTRTLRQLRHDLDGADADEMDDADHEQLMRDLGFRRIL